MSDIFVVQIDSDFKDLIPSFMENSREEIKLMNSALNENDLETVQRLGHSTKGAGRGYGFMEMGEIGLGIETAASEKKTDEIRKHIKDLIYYLDHVQITFIQPE